MTSCKKQNNTPKNAYHFKECGLDYVYLTNGFEIEEDSEYGNLVTIHNADDLQRSIARSVLLHREKLTGKELRFFRSLLQLTQEQMGGYLGVSREHITRNETVDKDKDLPNSGDIILRILVWEKYLDEEKALSFVESHKHERTHYKKIHMQESKQQWTSKIAA